MTDEELIRLAQEARENAYAPYSGFKVGAALETTDGDVFAGANVENASYGLSCCAERNAMFSAVNAGRRQFKRMVVISDQETPVRPCGACLQVMWEFAPELILLLVGSAGAVETCAVRDLLPNGFVFPKGQRG